MAEERLPRTTALLGAGVIGAGWGARLLLAGIDVRLYDPDPGAERAVLESTERARAAWARLARAPLPPEGTLTRHREVDEAVLGAELIQESAPEREALKRELLARASRAADPHALIASSTSGLLPSRLALDMEHPERFLVAHPFNPVYLLPLVELCGAQRTSPEAIERAGALYRALGMHPLLVRQEIDGFIADRLLEALWREALWLVADGVATAAEVDEAITYGPGLRWAAMGTFLTYRLAGGREGMRHFLRQFGPTLKLPWTRLTDVPELDERLLEELVSQSEAQADGRSIEDLTRIRDQCLVEVLRGLRDVGWGAGRTLSEAERVLAGRTDGAGAAGDPRLRLHEAVVTPEWIDYNGHMTESRYLEVLGDSTDAFLRRIGVLGAYSDSGCSYYTVETHIRHLAEAREGELLKAATRLLGHDHKRLHLFHELYRGSDGTPVATGEHMLVHVDRRAGRSAPAAEPVLAALSEIEAAQRALPWPPAAGASVNRFVQTTPKPVV